MDGWLKKGAGKSDAKSDANEALRLTLDEEQRSGARIKVVGVGGWARGARHAPRSCYRR